MLETQGQVAEIGMAGQGSNAVEHGKWNEIGRAGVDDLVMLMLMDWDEGTDLDGLENYKAIQQVGWMLGIVVHSYPNPAEPRHAESSVVAVSTGRYIRSVVNSRIWNASAVPTFVEPTRHSHSGQCSWLW